MNIVEMENELVIYLTNDELSNNYQEGYKEKNPNITHTTDNLYEFQGYKIYQLSDNTVSPSELDNPDRARLIFQCDKDDDIDRVVNQYFDLSTELWFPEIMVDGADNGISHSFKVTQDQFATGNKTLVNHKTYYFMALAYAYNAAEINADPYNPEGSGQNVPYKQGRRNIQVYSAIPHNNAPEDNGTLILAEYGDGVELTRLEGAGNGGLFLNFTQETLDNIINNNIDSFPVYQSNFGPIDIRVVDPTSVQTGDFVIMMDSVQDFLGWKLYEKDANGVLELIEVSDVSIYQQYEQVVTSLGISINMAQVTSPQYLNPVVGAPDVIGSGVSGETGEDGFIDAIIEFEDESNAWLSGISDQDETIDEFNNWDWAYNWIRSGNHDYDEGDNPADEREDENDYQYGAVQLPNNGGLDYYKETDLGEVFEGILGGTWAPYKFTSYFHDGPAVSSLVSSKVDMNELQSVDIIFTSDQSKWTRSVVLEAQDFDTFAEGGATKMSPRAAQSVDKDGNPDGTGTGMGWFPGYAVNLETGERLNIMFAEDSWLWSENGNDMKWNPTSNLETEVAPSYDYSSGHVFEGGTYLLGGKHFIYVMNSTYDECATYRNLFNSPALIQAQIQIFRETMWVGFPLLKEGEELLSNKATVKLRVKKPFIEYATSNNPINNDMPAYEFTTRNISPVTGVQAAADSALAMINVVPNPYYAYSAYEQNQLDNRIKITNLPQTCEIKIYTVGGQLIKTIKKDDPTITSVDWGLKNEYNIPIASGLYIIHVDVPGVGERVLKWLGVMRPIDLDTF